MKTLEKNNSIKCVLRLWKGPLPIQTIDSLRQAIWHMYGDSGGPQLGLTEKGFIDSTWDMVASCCLGQGELWLCLDGLKVRGYLMGLITRDFDHQPTYLIRHGWVDRELRGTPKVKEMLVSILANAKSNFCKHVLIVSSRNTKTYFRWLGAGWRPYTSMIKGDI